MGLTGPQFDVLAELGGTEGLTCAELGEATLITKGTLTGVLDRLEGKRLLERQGVKGDRRAIRVRLTAKGEELFCKAFPAHAEFMRPFIQQAFLRRPWPHGRPPQCPEVAPCGHPHAFCRHGYRQRLVATANRAPRADRGCRSRCSRS
ncbi:MAG: MarR family winged helix-turn-helix transcriptional regulator [Nitrospirales bacterium]